MNRTRAFALAGLFVLIACGQSAGVTLRYHFKPGRMLKYKTMITGAGEMAGPMGQPMRMVIESTSVAKHEVVDVAPDGTATLEMQITEGNMKMTMGGQEQKMPLPTEKQTFRITPRGKVIPEKEKAGAPEGLGAQFDFSDIMGAMEFPEKDLKIGDTWSGEATLNTGVLGQVSFKFTQRLKAVKNWKGRDCAVIDFTFEAPMKMAESTMAGSGKMAGSGTLYFDVKNGVDVQMAGQVVQVMMMTASMGEQKIDMKQTMKINMKQLLME